MKKCTLIRVMDISLKFTDFLTSEVQIHSVFWHIFALKLNDPFTEKEFLIILCYQFKFDF